MQTDGTTVTTMMTMRDRLEKENESKETKVKYQRSQNLHMASDFLLIFLAIGIDHGTFSYEKNGNK